MQLEPLPYSEKRNPHCRSGPPMRLYQNEDLERIAHEKWGGAEGLREEQAKRAAKREARAVDKAANAQTQGPRADTLDLPDMPLPGQAELHPLLVERIREVPAQAAADNQATQDDAAQPRSNSTGVLYWMNTALRAHENPALEVAVREAAARRVPLRVAVVLLASHPHMNTRRLTFALEGARDAQTELAKHGLHLQVWSRPVLRKSPVLRAGTSRCWCHRSAQCGACVFSLVRACFYEQAAHVLCTYQPIVRGCTSINSPCTFQLRCTWWRFAGVRRWHERRGHPSTRCANSCCKRSRHARHAGLAAPRANGTGLRTCGHRRHADPAQSKVATGTAGGAAWCRAAVGRGHGVRDAHAGGVAQVRGLRRVQVRCMLTIEHSSSATPCMMSCASDKI